MRTNPITWPAELLAKAVIRRSTTNSIFATNASIVAQHERLLYILRVLNAPADIRVAVREAAIANVTSGGAECQKQLVCILTLFETLSVAKQQAYINSFAACATTVAQGGMEVALENVWQWNHVPPLLEP